MNTSLLSSKPAATSASKTSARISVAFASLLVSAHAAFAQCDKTVVLASSKTEYLDADGTVRRTVEEDSVIKIGKAEVTISPNGHAPMIGAITSTTCDWKEAFKVGKTTLEAKFTDDNGTVKNATITIEGKDGRISCEMRAKETPDRIIRATIVKFEEDKPAAKP